VIILAVAAVANAAYFFKLSHDAVQIQVERAAMNREFERLTQIKVRYDDLTKQRDAYKRRVDVIDDLRAKQTGPVALLSTVGETVNHTNQIWLSSMADDGNAITLKGRALGVHAVADLMHNLETTGYFRTVAIKSSYQDEKVKDLQAFVFELNCEKLHPTTPAAPATAAKKS
jgi:Tfp pilus assembly protein PilN